MRNVNNQMLFKIFKEKKKKCGRGTRIVVAVFSGEKGACVIAGKGEQTWCEA